MTASETDERNPRPGGAPAGAPPGGSAFRAIRAIDYTVIFAGDMDAMRRFGRAATQPFAALRRLRGYPLRAAAAPPIEPRRSDNAEGFARESRGGSPARVCAPSQLNGDS